MRLEGKSVSDGIAMGRLWVYQKEATSIKQYKVQDAGAEVLRFQHAREMAKKQIADLYRKAVKEAGEQNAAIFEMYQMLLDDLGYIEAVVNMIEEQKVNAEFAVAAARDKYFSMFAAMEDDCMKARGADVKDICDRIISVLCGDCDGGPQIHEPVILLAEDLSPGEIVQLDKSKVLAFVTRYGSSNSHTAILARSMNIPALVGVEYAADVDGESGIVDGYTEVLLVNPDEETLSRYERKKAEKDSEQERLQELKRKNTVTLDGTKIDLYANINSVADLASVIANDADGIGLFRTEFLYLESENYPSEEEQFVVYKNVAENMAGKKVIIRTVDIGADKQAEYFGMEKEENPAMGYRGIRVCLGRPEIFKTQLRAIYRASCYGNISVMFPMIISVEEVCQVKAFIAQIKEELASEGIPYKDCEIGIMIETPAAAMISDLLAKEVDYFSIGTNDLTQYTLAIDRQNAKLDVIYNSHHEAILRMLRMVVENGHKEGCRVGICGEMGADTQMTEIFLKMGVDELSVSPSMILKVRDKIRNVRLK